MEQLSDVSLIVLNFSDGCLQGIDLSGKFGKLHLEVSPSGTPGESSPTEDPQLQQWEKGQMDYLGKDSYQNIEKHIDTVLNGKGGRGPRESVPKRFCPHMGK